MVSTTETAAASSAGFIQWCARAYGRTGMMETCLALQNQDGLNVNCMLAAVWAGQNAYRISESRWREIAAAIAAVDAGAVTPVRALRKSIQRNEALDADLRAGLKRMLLYAELRAEQAVESMLYDEITRGERGSAACVVENVLAYAGQENERIRRFLDLAAGGFE